MSTLRVQVGRLKVNTERGFVATVGQHGDTEILRVGEEGLTLHWKLGNGGGC